VGGAGAGERGERRALDLFAAERLVHRSQGVGREFDAELRIGGAVRWVIFSPNRVSAPTGR
jgi:hypothetical protein